MRTGQLKNLPYLKETRRKLRNNPTKAEAHLWKALRNSQLKGRKFRRQQSIDRYVVDFFCPAEKLIVELDGEIHNDEEQKSYDLERDARLIELGYGILRFENCMVFKELNKVVREIENCFADR